MAEQDTTTDRTVVIVHYADSVLQLQGMDGGEVITS